MQKKNLSRGLILKITDEKIKEDDYERRIRFRLPGIKGFKSGSILRLFEIKLQPESFFGLQFNSKFKKSFMFEVGVVLWSLSMSR